MRKALSTGNYSRFFKLYREAPNMAGSLIEIFIDKHRIFCLRMLCKAYIATNIDTALLLKLLQFEAKESLLAFLNKIGKFDETKNAKLLSLECIVTDENSVLDCKGSLPILMKAPCKVKRCIK